MKAAKGGHRTSDESEGVRWLHILEMCDNGLNATKRGQGCCAFCDVFVCVKQLPCLDVN